MFTFCEPAMDTNTIPANFEHIIVSEQGITHQRVIDADTVRSEQINNP